MSVIFRIIKSFAMKSEPCDVLPNGINSFSSSQLDNYMRFRKKDLIEANILSLFSLSRLIYNTLQAIDDKNTATDDISAAKYAVKQLEKISTIIYDDYDMIDSLEGFRYIETAVENINRVNSKAALHTAKTR